MTNDKLRAFELELKQAEKALNNPIIKVTGITIDSPDTYPYQIQGDLSDIIGVPRISFKVLVVMTRQLFEEAVRNNAENVSTVSGLDK